MIKATHIARKKIISAAIGSVQAEGLNPSQKTKKRLQEYAAGKITATEIRRATLNDVKSRQLTR